MRNFVIIIIVFLSQSIWLSCNKSSDNSSKELIKLVEERDSLKRENEFQSEKLSDYGQIIEVMNATLDTIALQENMMFRSNGDLPVTKDDVKYNLMRFEALLKKQGEKIKQLEDQLKSSNDSNISSLGLIAHLHKQISVKNNQIAQLKNELEKKNVSISQLQEIVESQRVTIDTQNATITELNKRTQKQGEALARQDAILNNGYVLIGSKKDLKRKGVITRKGKIVSDGVMDRTKFAKVDIRNWTEVSFTAQKPRILTNTPSTSYELTTNGDGNFTLTVKNPSDFWRISNYLVIQTD